MFSVSAIISIFFIVLSWVAKIMAVVFLALFSLTVFSQIANQKKKKEINAKSLWISILTSVGLILIFKFLGGMALTGQWWLIYILIPITGLLIGGLQAKFQKLFLVKGKILSKGTIWHLVLWAVPAVAIQIFYLLNAFKPLAWSSYVLIFSTSILVGTNLVLISRYYLLKNAALSDS